LRRVLGIVFADQQAGRMNGREFKARGKILDMSRRAEVNATHEELMIVII
jgi:hypothetical protein